jgi:hypothetical protein
LILVAVAAIDAIRRFRRSAVADENGLYRNGLRTRRLDWDEIEGFPCELREETTDSVPAGDSEARAVRSASPIRN